ncbi:protein of unknown function [Xenorhabdus poinarii G6]|uniref:Uncharacterized protein n=1 Tax=Xenorhabdus poinarii G6 TaxID=1354304 RepID=A0A068R1B3_9GAMM|nr:protein of unknown function [Xenorhabdus poinarii G6]
MVNSVLFLKITISKQSFQDRYLNTEEIRFGINLSIEYKLAKFVLRLNLTLIFVK